MERTKKSVYNIIIMLFSTVINSLMGLIYINLIIKTFGSDMNGIIATISQFIVMLSLLEGGLAMATNVALYKPYVQNDFKKINAILSGTRIIFLLISVIFTVIATIIAFLYPEIVQSKVNESLIITLFFMAIVPSAIGFLTDPYRVLFQVSQREYILSAILTLSTFLGQLASILLIIYGHSIIIVRIPIMVFAIFNSVIVLLIFYKYFRKVTFNERPNFSPLKSTFDVLIQKLTYAIYISLPMLIIASFLGTIYASVYMVYNSIFSIVKNGIYAFVNAPINGFGQLIAENGKSRAAKTFYIFEYLTIIILNILITTTIIFIIPFIRLYMDGVEDAVYVNWTIAILFTLIVSLEIIHIPSNIIINATGNFKINRNIQFLSFVVLLITSLSLTPFLGISGVLISVIICNILLSTLEIYYAHRKILDVKIKPYMKILISNSIISIIISFLGISNMYFNNYIQFFIYACIGFIVIATMIIIINILIFKKEMLEVAQIIKAVLRLPLKRK